MSRYQSPLDNIKVASPCSANWNEMYGNDRMRFCGDCKLNVYNLSGMSRQEAENLVMNAEGRLCVRFYQRRDGTVITRDCPVGWAKVKARAKVYVTAAFSVLMTFLGGMSVVSIFSSKPRTTTGTMIANPTPTPNYTTMGAIAVNSNTATMGDVAYTGVMGNVALPTDRTRRR
jgi:hypothetical protein